MPALKKTTRAATGSGRKGLKMNERNNLKEILQRSREGRMFDQEGLRKVVQNFLYTPFPEVILSNSNGYNIEAFEWSKAILESVGLPNREYSYLYLIRRMKELSEAGGVDEDALFYLTSICFVPGKAAGFYMGIAVEDLIKEAGLEDLYNVWLKQDVDLYREQKGREPSVRTVLQNCMANYIWLKNSKKIKGEDVFSFPVMTKEVIKPFCRLREAEETETIRDLTFAWVWILMVQAPECILMKNTNNNSKGGN